MHVDEARRYDESVAVDDADVIAVGRASGGLERFDPAVGDNEIADLVELLRRIQHATATQDQPNVGVPVPRSPFPAPFAASASPGLPPASR